MPRYTEEQRKKVIELFNTIEENTVINISKKLNFGIGFTNEVIDQHIQERYENKLSKKRSY